MSGNLCILLGIFFYLMDVGETNVNLFYHEHSQKTINSPLMNPSQFGFSMTYQPALISNQSSSPKKLVVGAPKADVDGQVYTCSIDEILYHPSPKCTKLPIDLTNTSNPGHRIISPAQEFWLGASLAATSKYIFICAPLWSDMVNIGDKFQYVINGSFGHCYIFDEISGLRSFYGLLENEPKENDQRSIMGGFGWSMLIDENLGHWIIGKPALNGYFSYAKLKNAHYRFFTLSKRNGPLKGYRHVGNAFAVGNYFTDFNGTVLAISATRYLKGTILFAQYLLTKRKKGYYLIPGNAVSKYFELQNNAIGSMFGEALCAVDLSGDGHDELVVGAPAYSDSVKQADVGAVHVYLSGNRATITQQKRKFTIVGMQEGGYFGRAIISVGDLDSDGFFELCVGAPYEDGGAGAVYVMSGREINSVLLEDVSRTIKLNNLRFVQRLTRANTQSYGFSLLSLPDVDGNGCNEFVVAAPKGDSLAVYRCSPSINISINLELQNCDIVPENVKSFDIKVCYKITYPTRPEIITNKLIVSNKITGSGVTIKKNMDYLIEIRLRNPVYCEEIPIHVSNNYPGYYDFTTSYNLDEDMTHTDFDNNWVKVYPESPNNQTLRVIRGCSTQECTPRLTATLNSSIGEANVTYVLGSTSYEKVSFNITNEGDSAYLACVRINVDGPTARIDCARRAMYSTYTCDLPKPFVKDAKFPIKMQLDMTTMTNMNRRIGVTVVLDKNCDQNNTTQETLSYDVKPNIDSIVLEGFDKEWSITMNETNLNKSINFEQVYLITNNDTVVWKELKVKIDLKKEKYLEYMNVLMTSDDGIQCVTNDMAEYVSFECDSVRINQESYIKVSLPLVLILNNASTYIDNGLLEIMSTINLQLVPTGIELYKNVSHVFRIRKESLRFDQNKNSMLLLFISLGLLLLIIVAIILYKCGFFKRKEKQKLRELKEEIRRKSIRRSQHGPLPKDTHEENDQTESSGDGPEPITVTTSECTDDTKQLVEKDGKEVTVAN